MLWTNVTMSGRFRVNSFINLNTGGKYRALGIMSGTSLDGLDMALCDFTFDNGRWDFQLINSRFVEYSDVLRQELRDVYNSPALKLVELDAKFGQYVGKQARQFLDEVKSDVDLIASHGQTIFHNPLQGYTCQIGSGAHIASMAGEVTVADFRSQDVANGGHGAPLVPIGDKFLFPEYAACVNLGGFANISYDYNKQRIAYDICPVNIVMNKLANGRGLPFDKGGGMARGGQVVPVLLDQLERLPFYIKDFPKSLGQEWVDDNIWPLIKDQWQTCDVLRTFSAHVATRIAAELNKVEGNGILFTGGGVNNSFLIEQVKQKSSKKIVVPNTDIVDMKEAILFAFLGVLRIREDVNCLASVTGAHKDTVGGVIHLP